jgi:Flp pilus assembly secretin CpaC
MLRTRQYVTEAREFGQTLDVMPIVLDDGYTIALTVIPTVTEFLGYEEDPTNRIAVYVNGKKKWVTPPRPKVQQRQMYASVRCGTARRLFWGARCARR